MAVQETKDYESIAERIVALPMGVSEMFFDATVVFSVEDVFEISSAVDRLNPEDGPEVLFFATDMNPGKAEVFKDTDANIKLFMKLYDTLYLALQNKPDFFALLINQLILLIPEEKREDLVFLDSDIKDYDPKQKIVSGLDSVPPSVAFALAKLLKMP